MCIITITTKYEILHYVIFRKLSFYFSKIAKCDTLVYISIVFNYN